MFTAIDWIVLVAYLLVSLFIGLWVSRGNKNLKEYMFAEAPCRGSLWALALLRHP